MSRGNCEHRFPLAQRAIDVAANPARKRAHVRLLARCSAGGILLGRAQRVGGGRYGGAAVCEHHHVAEDAVAEGKARIGVAHALSALDHIGVEAGERAQRMVEESAGGGVRADLQVVGIFHGPAA